MTGVGNMKNFLWIILLWCALLTLPTGAESASVTVRARPREFRAGGTTLVSIIFGKEPRKGGIALPQVEGAEWRTDQVSVSTSVNVVNGRSSRSETCTLPLFSSRPGELTIPPFEVRFADGTTAKSNPVKLTVLAPGETAKNAEPEPSGRIRVGETRAHFYVGESIPVKLELAVPEGMKIAKLDFPELRCDGPMVMPDLGGQNSRHPHYQTPVEETRETPDGDVVTVTFPTRPRFMRPGNFTLTATEPVTLAVPRSPDRANDIFNDPFFSDRFFRQETRRMRVVYPPVKLKILPVPEAPKGVHRLGMCADAKLEAALSAVSARAGEPLELEVSVHGETEFADLITPILALPGFRVYPPTDKKVASGVRSIRYALIPLSPGEHRIDLGFAVFDPAAGVWKTVSVKKTLAVTGAAETPPQPPPAAPPPKTPATAQNAPGVKHLLLRPEKRPEVLRFGEGVTTMPLEAGLVRSGLVFFALAFLALAVEVVRRMRKKHDPAEAERRRQVAALIRRAKNGECLDAVLRDGGLSVLARGLDLPEDALPAEIAEKIADAELRQLLDELEYNTFAPVEERHIRPISAAARRRFVKLLKRALIFAVLVLALDLRAADESCRHIRLKRLDPNYLYNTGMTFRRDGDLPRARAALEQAHRLAPRDREILAALEKTENDLGASPSERTLRDLFRPDEYLVTAGVLFGLALLGFALLRKTLRRTAFAAAWILAAIGAVAVALAWSQYGENGPYRTDRAIVIGKKPELSSLPLENGGRIVGTLDGGAEVVIVEERGDFTRVRSGDKDGWCRFTDVDRILPEQFRGGISIRRAF